MGITGITIIHTLSLIYINIAIIGKIRENNKIT